MKTPIPLPIALVCFLALPPRADAASPFIINEDSHDRFDVTLDWAVLSSLPGDGSSALNYDSVWFGCEIQLGIYLYRSYEDELRFYIQRNSDEFVFYHVTLIMDENSVFQEIQELQVAERPALAVANVGGKTLRLVYATEFADVVNLLVGWKREGLISGKEMGQMLKAFHAP